MKIFTQFILLHKNIGFPSENDFCTYIWQSDDFDSDGDYYFDNIGDQWTNLDLKSFDEGHEAEFELTTYRENGVFQLDSHGLKHHLDEFRNGAFKIKGLSVNDTLAASDITISAKNLEMYRKLLETVHFFLDYSKGFLLNYGLMDADAFKKEFLDD